MVDLKIDNNRSASRFEVLINGALSVLDYHVVENAIYLLHVEVPESEQGRGIASCGICPSQRTKSCASVSVHCSLYAPPPRVFYRQRVRTGKDRRLLPRDGGSGPSNTFTLPRRTPARSSYVLTGLGGVATREQKGVF